MPTTFPVSVRFGEPLEEKPSYEESCKYDMPIRDIPVGTFFVHGGFVMQRIDDANGRIQCVYSGRGKVWCPDPDSALARGNPISRLLVEDTQWDDTSS